MRMLRAAPSLAALFLAACASHVQVHLEHQPIASAYVWKKPQKPRLHLDKVEDRTGDLPGVLLSPPLAQALRQALQVELDRMGLAAPGGAAEADLLLDVAATSLEAAYGLNTAKLALALTLKSKDSFVLSTGQVKGVSKDQGRSFASAGLLAETLNGALSDAMAKLGPALDGQVLTVAAPGEVDASPERVVRSDIDELPARPAAAKRKAHAIVIGARRYRQKLPEADFADSDARLVSRYLTEVLGYPRENVATLINEQAARSDFEKYFERWLPNRVEPGDEVFFYYSGHGAPNPATGEAYLVPFDGDPTYLAETAYPLKKMYAALARLPAGKVTVVMDSCFSGAGGRSVLAKGARPLVNVIVGEAFAPNMTVLSASAGHQTSHSYDEKGHGLFTYFFLKGIKEGAAKGAMDMKAVFDFAAPQVSRIARREYNADQVPQWRGGGQ